MPFTYIYISQSEVDPERFYTGLTSNLRERLKRHNDGSVPHTSKWRSWTPKHTLLCQIDSARKNWKVFEITFRPRIPEEAPVNLQSVSERKCPP
jgi:hypothetical protein